MKKAISLLLIIAMIFVMAGCGKLATEKPKAGKASGEETTPKKNGDTEGVDMSIVPESVVLQKTDALRGKKIGCSIVYKGDEWCYALSVALETLGKYYGADITVEDGDLNDETQTKQIENMVAANCDILMIDPTTPDGCHQALMKAKDAGIPIIIYDGYWSEGEKNALTTVTWDQHQTGVLVGEYFIKYVRKKCGGKAKVIELANAVSTHCQERFVGLHEVIDKANSEGCQIEVLDKFDSQGNRETAYNAISAIVEPYDFVISDVDNGAMGAVSALQATGNKDVKVLSMGAYGEEPFTTLNNNHPNYLACLNVDPWILAQFIFDAAIGAEEGTEVPTKTNIDLFIVDSENVKEFWNFD